MLRILHVVHSMGCGGIETSLMKLHRKIDKNIIQFDYYSYRENDYYEKEIEKLGGIIYHSRRVREMGIFKAYGSFVEFLSQHPEYKIIHIHGVFFGTIHLLAAKRNKRIGIVHSRSTNSPQISLESIIGKIFSYPERYLADYFFAVSPKAGIDRFGKNVKITFFHNGIDIHKYSFSPEIRKTIRESRGINSESTLVVGHVGGFRPPKNHKFLIEVFRELHTKVPNSRLWLIGDGTFPLKNDIQVQIHNYGLDDAVDFIGLTNRVNEYLMGMDVFAFPSFYEGLSGALMEAQCSGLPCIASYGNQDEGIVSDRVKRLSINSPNDAEIWADAIIEANTQRDNREKYPRIIADAGFDIETTARELQDFYFSLVKP